MEDWQQIIIETNRSNLIQLISCNALFISKLWTILSGHDVDDINKYEKQNLTQASTLLDILKTKENGFDKLKIALNISKQSGALKLIEDAETKLRRNSNEFVKSVSQHGPSNPPMYSPPDPDDTSTEVSSAQYSTAPPLPEALNTDVRKFKRVQTSPHHKIQADNFRKFHLIFSTPDNTITIKRIKEEHDGNQNTLIISETAYPDGFSLQTNATMAGVNIISHERHPLANLLRQVEDSESTFQAVIVTSKDELDVEIALKQISYPGKFKILQEDLMWDFITMDYQNILLNRKVIFQGNRLGLREIAHDPSNLNTMSLPLLVSLINAEEPVLCEKTCVKMPSTFYIQRELVSRRLVSTKIMEKASEQSVIAVEGVTDSEMKAISRGSFQSSDTQVNKEILCKNIVLRNGRDFKKLKAKGVDIYWLKKDRNDNVKNFLKFIKASDQAKLGFVQNYIKPDFTNGTNESDLVNSQDQEPICIGDMPGMGKTELLRSIANRLMSQESTRTRFVLCSNMTELLKNIPNVNGATEETVLEAILAKTDTDGKSKTLIHSLVTKYIGNVSDEIKVEILIDGFDDVLQEKQVAVAIKILEIVKGFKSTRLWVALRSHMLNQVEDTLKVIGYNMKPLLIQDQIQFLVNYWQSAKDKVTMTGTLDEKRLRVFATSSLAIIRSNLHEEVDKKSGAADLMSWEMTGNPLQCYLIADAYIEDAIRFAHNDTYTLANIFFNINSSSIKDLFDRIFEKKLDIYLEERVKIDLDGSSNLIRQDAKDAMMREHTKYAILSLFPDFDITDFDVLFETNNPKSKEDVAKYGLITTFDPETEKPEFVHKTYAEFFVAKMVIEWGSSGNSNSELITKLAKFFVHKVLAVGYPEMKPNTRKFIRPSEYLFSIWNDRKPKSPYFTNPVIPYFINSFLDESKKGKKYLLKANFRSAIATIWMKEKGLLVSKRCPKFVAAILSNYFKIVELLIKSLEDKNLKRLFVHKTQAFHMTIVNLATEHSSKECVEYICDLFYLKGKMYKHFLCPPKKSYMSMLQVPVNVLKEEESANLTSSIPLHAALVRGEYDIYKLFVNTQGFIKERWENLRAVTPKHAGLLHFVIKDSWHDTESVIDGKKEIIKSLCQANPKIVDEKDDDGRTPLLQPEASIELLKELVKQNAKIDTEDKIEKKTILHMICAMPNVYIYNECLALLQIDKMKSLRSPVRRAEKFTKMYSDILVKEREGEVTYTLENEVDINNNLLELPSPSSSNSGQAGSFSQSLYQNSTNSESSSFSIQSDSSPSETTPGTASKKSLDITQDLMSKLLEANKFAKSIEFLGYLINKIRLETNTFCPKSSKGVTPLHYAAATGNLEVIKLFIDGYKADVNIEDDKLRTMLYHVTRSKNNVQMKIIKYLMGKGAIDKNGKSLRWALIKGSPEKGVVEYLDTKRIEKKLGIDPEYYVNMVHNVFCNPNIDVGVLREIIEHCIIAGRKTAPVTVLDIHKDTGRTILHHAALNLTLDGLKLAMELVTNSFQNNYTLAQEFVSTEDYDGNTLWHMVYLSFIKTPQSYQEKKTWLQIHWRGKLPFGENKHIELPPVCKNKNSKTYEHEKQRNLLH